MSQLRLNLLPEENIYLLGERVDYSEDKEPRSVGKLKIKVSFVIFFIYFFRFTFADIVPSSVKPSVGKFATV